MKIFLIADSAFNFIPLLECMWHHNASLHASLHFNCTFDDIAHVFSTENFARVKLLLKVKYVVTEWDKVYTLCSFLSVSSFTLLEKVQIYVEIKMKNWSIHCTCFYFQESRNIVHGNISARNVLVTRPAASNLIVKLGDPMLSVYYHSLPIEHDVKMKR